MKPTGIDYNAKKGYSIIHECRKCSKIIKNKVSSYDDWDKIINLSKNNVN